MYADLTVAKRKNRPIPSPPEDTVPGSTERISSKLESMCLGILLGF